MPDDLVAERVDEFLSAYRTEIMRMIGAGGKRPREVRAVARIEGGQLAKDSHIEPPRAYPFDSP